MCGVGSGLGGWVDGLGWAVTVAVHLKASEHVAG